MFIVYLSVTILAAVANGFSAVFDFIRYERILLAMDRAGVPRAWLTPLGLLKAAGALGLLVGIVAPPVGVAAAAGLSLFFVAAVLTHLRVRDFAIGLPVFFLGLALAALAVRIATTEHPDFDAIELAASRVFWRGMFWGGWSP